MWFPRPASETDVVVVDETAPLDRKTLLSWLGDPTGAEWRERVGVAGSNDGSARSTTRLLHVDGWVLKTRVDERGTLGSQSARLARLAHVARSGIWHPSKRFFLLRDTTLRDTTLPDTTREHEADWLIASACPCLPTLRSIADPERRLASFVAALVWSFRISREAGLGLDLNPSNFALDPIDLAGRIHYLDDETYPSLGPREVGEALAGRLPEEDLDTGVLERIGQIVATRFESTLRAGDDWPALIRGLEDYPLVAACEPRRAALRTGLRAELRARRERRRRAPALTCVLGDVHANLPALDAVLAAARAAGVDSYVVLGDVVGYGPHPSECIARIIELAPDVCLRGNHDHAVATGSLDDTMNRMAREVARWTTDRLSAAEREWLGALAVEHVGDRWMAVHGAPRDPNRFYAYVYELTFRDNLDHMRERGLPLCFYGHTHVPFVHRGTSDGSKERLGARDLAMHPADTLLVSPGSVGQPRDGDQRAAFLLWDRREQRVSFQRATYRVEDTVRDLARFDLPRDLAYRLETGR